MRKNKRIKIIGSVIATLLIALSILLGNNVHTYENKILEQKEVIAEDTKKDKLLENENLKVYFLDVGQADSIYIECQGSNLLIDAGTNKTGERVVEFLKQKEVKKIDYLVGTHPHEDHIGGLDLVIKQFDIGTMYMPKIQTNTKTFEDVLDAAIEKDLSIESPKIGQIFNIGDAKCEMMSSIIDQKNLNLSSLVLRLTYENNSFLFMGDAENENETKREWPQTQILKVGHHGSKTSTTKKFLDEIKPEIAVISVGKDNTYGHPNEETITRLEKNNIKVYRTDKLGTILITADGKDYVIKQYYENKIEKNVSQ